MALFERIQEVTEQSNFNIRFNTCMLGKYHCYVRVNNSFANLYRRDLSALDSTEEVIYTQEDVRSESDVRLTSSNDRLVLHFKLINRLSRLMILDVNGQVEVDVPMTPITLLIEDMFWHPRTAQIWFLMCHGSLINMHVHIYRYDVQTRKFSGVMTCNYRHSGYFIYDSLHDQLIAQMYIENAQARPIQIDLASQTYTYLADTPLRLVACLATGYRWYRRVREVTYIQAIVLDSNDQEVMQYKFQSASNFGDILYLFGRMCLIRDRHQQQCTTSYIDKLYVPNFDPHADRPRKLTQTFEQLLLIRDCPESDLHMLPIEIMFEIFNQIYQTHEGWMNSPIQL